MKLSIAKRIYYKLKSYKDMLYMLIARFVSLFYNGEGVWLVGEKPDEARDNGYWFYKYLVETEGIKNAYYVLSSTSADYQKIISLPNARIVEPSSFKHRLLFWAALYNVSSQPLTDYFSSYRRIISLRKKSQVNVFLQHGIIKDNLSHGIDAEGSGIDIFITSAKREQQAVIERHGYNEKTCALTGLCRFDNLKPNASRSRTILVMPTFRHWIMAQNGHTATKEERTKFLNDDFCMRYNYFLSSRRLEAMLEKYDYKLIFYPHYCAQPFLDCFEDPGRTGRVVLASNKKYDVQKLLIDSDILITDFSSIFFDFAYMKKPEAFYQFDEARYRDGHYEEGYFKYREDAFGPVITEENEMLNWIESRLQDNAKMEEKFIQRVDNFFAYTDQNNCERTYNTIVNFESK